MNFSVGDTIGQWKIIKFISGHNGAYIYEVCTTITDYDDIIKKLYGKSLWAIKLKDIRFDDESQTIIKHTLSNNAYILNIPNEETLFRGRYGNYDWYVIELYTDDIGKNMKFAKDNFSRLLMSMCNFLKFLHRERCLIHGDIKLQNVLFKEDANILFKICDYETIKKPDLSTICREAGYDGYYYYSLGCHPDKSYNTYRMDLEAFGIILWSVMSSQDDVKIKFAFQQKSWSYYENKNKNDHYYDLDILKEKDKENMPEIIKKYFEIISFVDWELQIPPNIGVYNKINNLILNI
jgi:serine/threonine protein kinase